MQGKKRYLALVLFLLLGLVTFSFANPDDQLEPVEGNVKKVSEQKDEKRVQTKFEEAKELVEKAEQNPTPEIIAEAEEILEEAQQEQPELVQEEDLVNRLNNTEPAIDAAALINAVEKMIDEATKKDDVSAAKTYFDNNNVATVTNNLEDGTVKENLNIRVAYLVKVFADETAPVITGIENNQTTNREVTLSISDDLDVNKKITLDGEEIEFKDTFNKDGVYVVVVTDDAQNTTSATFTIDKVKPKFEGLPSREAHIESYKVDVTDATDVAITLQKDHGTFVDIEEGYEIVEEGTYQLVGVDKAGNKYTTWIIIDKTAPTITNSLEGEYINQCTTVTVFDRYMDKVTINDDVYKRADFTKNTRNENFKLEKEICEVGTYTITATDKIGKKTTKTFTIDKTAPVVTLKGKNKVLEPGHYTYTLKAVIEDDNAYTALLNGKEYVSGTDITARDNYTLVVTDVAGNMTTIEFAIDKDKPKIKGVANKGYYNYDVTPEVTDKNLASVTLNDQEYVSGTTITEEGVYTLVAKDIAGNKSTATFTIDKTAATRVSTDFYVHKLTAVDKVYYTQKDNKVTLNIKVNEELKQIPTFTLHSNGVDYVLTDVLNRGENAPGKWLYQASYVITEELADGELTFTISNIYDLAGNQTADITATTNGRRVIVDNTPNRVTQTFYRGSEVEGLKYYLTNGNKIQFNIGFRELLAEPAKVTIGGKEVELKYDKYYVATNSHMYYGYLEAAEDESDLVPGELEVKIGNIVDYAGNKGFYYQTNGKKVYDTYKFTATTNGKVAIYKLSKAEVETVEEFVEAVSKTSEITLLNDIELDSTIELPEDKDLVIDLNENTIELKDTEESKGQIKTKGNLTIKNGTLENNDIKKNVLIDKEDGTLTLEDIAIKDKASYSGTTIFNRKGKMIINNSSITIDSENTGCMAGDIEACGNTAIENYGDLTITNTTINSDASKRYGITTHSGNVVIDNVTLNVKRRGGLAIQGGNVTVSNSNISTYWYAFYVANYNGDTNLTINSGSYVASGYSIIYNGNAVKTNKGLVTINGGTFQTQSNKRNLLLLDGTAAEGQEFGIAIKGGTWKATKNNAADYVADGYVYDKGTVKAE